MARYKITLRHKITGHVEEKDRRRIDAARAAFALFAYQGLAANGLLDTRSGHAVMAQAADWPEGEFLPCGGSYVACWWRYE
jgi:hypothetical protein